MHRVSCGRSIRRSPAQQSLVQVAAASSGIAGFGEDEAGELYAADLGGQIYRISAVKR